MGTVTVSLPADGSTGTVSQYNTPLTTVVNEFNGNIDNANIKPNAAIAGSKLASDVPTSKLSNAYKFSVYKTSGQSIATLTTAKIAFDTKTYDTGTNFDVVTNNRFTAPIAGFYFISAAVQISSAGMTSGAVGIALLYKNGSEVKRGAPSVGTGNTNNLVASQVTDVLQLAANDYIEVFAYNGDSSSRTTGAGANLTYMSGFLVSAT